MGFGTLDDAGVYALSPALALVQTVDFITPVVDDPYAFGQIAVANALSDVWAMGGEARTALNVVCIPSGLDPQVLRAILAGGLDKFAEAGVALLGGHTVDDKEIKYGASVTGTVHPERIWGNNGARVGDALVLTKAIGTGVVSTAVKRGLASPDAAEAASLSMRTLNRAARDAAVSVAPHACTDVTGFGLLGHLSRIAVASGVTARVDSVRVPLLPDALLHARDGVFPGGMTRNRDHFGPRVTIRPGVGDAVAALLYDPQTSGGLLFSVAPGRVDILVQELAGRGVNGTVIGEIVGASDGRINVV